MFTSTTSPPGMTWLLGMFQAGLFPGVAYYLSWYAPIILLNFELSPRLVGTSVQNTAYARRFSSLRHQ